ncbi:MAG: hypothetical protein WAV42_03785, partial [Gemmiger qucibialis]
SAYLLSFTFVCIIFVLLPRSNAANHSKHGSPSAHNIALCGGEFLCLRAFVEYYGTGIPS